jgi:4-hydroxybenzoate polyprenyltransferase
VTWHDALRLGRVSNLPTVWTNVAAAAVLADAPRAPAAFVAVALACSLFYVGGMFLNDAFDREFDARMRRERPIPAGLVSVPAVFATGFGLLAAGLVVVATTARLVLGDATTALVAGGALAAAIVLYDAWHKANPVAPLLMGLCRVLVYVTTSAALTGAVPNPVVGGALVLLAYLVGLTYVARQETLGSVRNLWPLGCLGVPFVLWSLSLHEGPFGVALYWGAVAWVLACVSHLGWRSRVDVPRAVVGLIAGIALVDALAIASFGHAALAVWAVAAFAFTLTLQRWVPGT